MRIALMKVICNECVISPHIATSEIFQILNIIFVFQNSTKVKKNSQIYKKLENYINNL